MSKFKFDTHAHFDLYEDREKVLRYMESERSYTIAVTNLPDLFERYINSNKTYRYIRYALGFHPELAYQFYRQVEVFDRNINFTRFIGEVGLDFTTMDENNRRTQEQVFTHIVQACSKSHNKILTVHSRKAEKRVLEILDNLSDCSVILHWYSGSLKNMEYAIDRGYYFSINHNMVNCANGRKIVDHIPFDKILLESDAPFTKGQKTMYTVEFMNDIYAYLCKSRAMDEAKVAHQLKTNFKDLLEQHQ